MPKIAYVGGCCHFQTRYTPLKLFCKIYHKIFPQDSPQHFPQDFPTRISCKIFPQDFTARISRKIFPQDFLARFSHRIFPQEFPAGFSVIGWQNQLKFIGKTNQLKRFHLFLLFWPISCISLISKTEIWSFCTNLLENYPSCKIDQLPLLRILSLCKDQLFLLDCCMDQQFVPISFVSIHTPCSVLVRMM